VKVSPQFLIIAKRVGLKRPRRCSRSGISPLFPSSLRRLALSPSTLVFRKSSRYVKKKYFIRTFTFTGCIVQFEDRIEYNIAASMLIPIEATRWSLRRSPLGLSAIGSSKRASGHAPRTDLPSGKGERARESRTLATSRAVALSQ